MSAIAGVWSFDKDAAVSAACQEMLAALSVYGKDRSAQYQNPSIGLGVCLFRSLPEDRFDQQPLKAPGVSCLIADVRLDNRSELVHELGIADAAMADSALLLAAWQRWGEECLGHLSGAFSFAVWNEQEQRLFLARDHTGERPLFYTSGAGWFAFASMPVGLHALPFVTAAVDEDYLARYLTMASIPIEQTVFRNIHRLPSGCAMSVQREKVRVWRHWNFAGFPELRLGSAEEYIECFRERFDRAVEARLRNTGPIGAQLSGGLDSGSVSATAAVLLAAQGRDLTCFTSIPQAAFSAVESATHFDDEGAAAAEVAALYPNVRHVRVRSGGTSFLDILDHNNALYNHPCFGPSNEVWLNAIFDEAKSMGITVMLNGNCGNSTISYSGMHAFSAWFRSGAWGTLARVGRQLVQQGGGSMRTVVRNAVWPSLPFWLRSRTDPHMRGFSLDYSALRPEIAKELDLERSAFRDIFQVSPDGRTMLRTLLEQGDIADTPIAAQGGWQMDFRDPTYDRRVVEFCLTVPLEEFLRDGQQRSLVRRAMVGRLPESTRTRTRRGRQSADWYVSLAAVRPRMLEEVTRLKGSPLAARMLDLTRMQSLIESWPAEGFERPEIMSEYHIALTRGFSVGRFLLRYDSGRAVLGKQE
jgi:asparagine synthase (glutamine-hydrolysing)